MTYKYPIVLASNSLRYLLTYRLGLIAEITHNKYNPIILAPIDSSIQQLNDQVLYIP